MASLLDGTGQIKIAVLDEAVSQTQRLHGIVERYAMALKNQQETGSYRQQLMRAGAPLAGILKPQFSVTADSVNSFLQIAGRGGSDQVKVRALREAVASIRAQLEIAASKVKEKHSVGGATAGKE